MRGRWAAFGVGSALMAYALVGAWRDLGDDRPLWVVWLVGGDLAHDLLVAPALGLVGVVVSRLLPAGRVRTHVQVGLIASGSVLLVAWVPLMGLGGNPGNPTIRPLDYGMATATAFGLVWLVVVASAATGALLRARASRLSN